MEDIFHTMLIATRSVQFRAADGATLGWRPPLDVYETEDALYVVAELAGVAEDQIEVAVDEDILTIRGERAPLPFAPGLSIHEMGILRGHFAADIYLPLRIEPTKIAINRQRGTTTPSPTPGS
jgi:HSP20 family molecular chaperone IbpA